MYSIQKTFLAIASIAVMTGTTAEAQAQSYKGFPAGYCTNYAARQFDNAAPSPGVNWRGNAAQWAGNAYGAGWQVSTSVYDAPYLPNGTIIVWNDGGYGHVGIFRGYSRSLLTVDEMNWDAFNYVDRHYLTYAQVQNRGSRGTYRFAGYILPRRR